MIIWRKNAAGDTISACGRFKIESKYWGCVRPTSYELKVDGKREATDTLLRDAKKSAQGYLKRDMAKTQNPAEK